MSAVLRDHRLSGRRRSVLFETAVETPVGVRLRSAEHPALRAPAAEVLDFGTAVRCEVAELLGVLRRLGGGAIAGPQVGIDRAIVVVDRPGLRAVLINPSVYGVVSHEVAEWEECRSVPGFRWRVTRADELVVTARDERGRRVHGSVDGSAARCLHHAVDHLRGRLPAERATAVLPLPVSSTDRVDGSGGAAPRGSAAIAAGVALR